MASCILQRPQLVFFLFVCFLSFGSLFWFLLFLVLIFNKLRTHALDEVSDTLEEKEVPMPSAARFTKEMSRKKRREKRKRKKKVRLKCEDDE